LGIRKLGLAIGFVFALLLALPPAPALAAPVQTAPVQASCVAAHGRLVCNGHSVRRPTRHVCVYVTRGMVEAAGWQQIGVGVGFSVWGLLADGTIIGIPLGAFLGIIGIGAGTSGSAILWYAGSYFRPGWYCGYV